MVSMTKLKINLVDIAPALGNNVAVVLGVQSTSPKVKLAKSVFDSKALQLADLVSLGVSSDAGSLVKLAGPQGSLLALAGIGTKPSVDGLREAAGLAARELGHIGHLIFDLALATEDEVLAVLEGAMLGNYEFLKYKPKSSPRKLAKLTILTSVKVPKTKISELELVVDAVHACRDLVNLPANDLFPEEMVKAAKSAAKGAPVKIKVWGEKELIADGLGGIHAVGRGSSRPPRLVKIEYRPAKAKTSLALVGKGITFDTGGLSLKPAESMVGMKYDMTGAAVVMQAVLTVAKLGLPIKTTAWLCLAENMPSGGATRPNDVIKIRNGKTVEVLNTDAEGRLVLADGLSMAVEEKPDFLVDVATLTGAATIALGNRYAGLMGDNAIVRELEKAAKAVGELVWPMPLPEELRALLNSDIADIANVKIGNRAGGMLIGGLFLREFVTNKDGSGPAWAHLDIAGPANNDSAAYGFIPKGATGVMVRTLVNLAKNLAN